MASRDPSPLLSRGRGGSIGNASASGMSSGTMSSGAGGAGGGLSSINGPSSSRTGQRVQAGRRAEVRSGTSDNQTDDAIRMTYELQLDQFEKIKSDRETRLAAAAADMRVLERDMETFENRRSDLQTKIDQYSRELSADRRAWASLKQEEDIFLAKLRAEESKLLATNRPRALSTFVPGPGIKPSAVEDDLETP